jgi:SAM-dependent methyltransferase
MSELLSEYYESFHEERQKLGTVSIPERFEFIRREVGKDKKVVELGCRFGGLLQYFIEGNEVVGVDIDRNALVICREKFGIETHVANLNDKLPYSNSEFDVVVLSEVLEHLPYPELTFQEISRILKNEGKLVGSVPNATHLRNRLRFLLTGVVELDRTHLQQFSASSLKVMLNGFFENIKIVSVSGRFIGLSERLFANYLLFSCHSPKYRD